MLYKVTLKTYSQVLIERGYHSLFFPGGTRERSGMVEQKLKLGLMGSALAAFSERVRRGDTRPIYIVPVTINYPLVLEAETLIDDYLKAKGQARYIIEDDEFSRMGRVANFAVKVMALDTTMIIRYGQPLDVFGNVVAADGTSRGPDGTVLEPTRYMERDGVPVDDPARDAEYTRQLGRAVADAFRRETVVLPTQLIGWVLFERERQRGGPKLDLFTLLRTTSGDTHQWAELCTAVDRVRVRLVALEKAGEIRLDDTVRTAPVDTLVSEAVSTFGMYHTRAAVERVGEDVIVRDPKLLFYYGNRLSSWTDTLREVLA
jgi:glycerol-3-phosphate O-acyltransferase